jgi:DNA-binding protein Fis
MQSIGQTQRSIQERTVWKNAQQVICDIDAEVVQQRRLVLQQWAKELLDIFMQNTRNFMSHAKAIMNY